MDTNSAKGNGQLSVRLKDTDETALIRERTHFNHPAITQLPKLELGAQTGGIGSHVDVAAHTESCITVAKCVISLAALAELTWALLMAAAKNFFSTFRTSNMRLGNNQKTILLRLHLTSVLVHCSKKKSSASRVTVKLASWFPFIEEYLKCV